MLRRIVRSVLLCQAATIVLACSPSRTTHIAPADRPADSEDPTPTAARAADWSLPEAERALEPDAVPAARAADPVAWLKQQLAASQGMPAESACPLALLPAGDEREEESRARAQVCPEQPEEALASLLRRHGSQTTAGANGASRSSTSATPEDFDRELVLLAGCGALSPGLITNLRAEYLPECAPQLYLQMHSELVRDGGNAELLGRALATLIEARAPVASGLEDTLTEAAALAAIEAEILPELRNAATHLADDFAQVDALAPTPGKTLALAALVRAWSQLLPPLPKNLERSARVRAAYLGAVDEAAPGRREEVDAAFSAHLSWDGAVHTRAARFARALHARSRGRVLREPVDAPWPPAASLWARAPAPHFASQAMRATMSAESAHELSKLAFAGGYPPSARALLLRHLRKAPRDRTVRTRLGQHHLAKAVLFGARQDAERATILLAPLANGEVARVDVALARALEEALATNAPFREALADALPPMSLNSPLARARHAANRGWPGGVELSEHLPPNELDCFADARPFGAVDHCEFFAWLWPDPAATSMTSRRTGREANAVRRGAGRRGAGVVCRRGRDLKRVGASF